MGDADGRVLERAAEPLLALAQRLLGPLPVGDVPRQRHGALLATVPEGFAPDFDRKARPLLATVSGLERDRLSGEELALDLLQAGGSDVGVKVERRHPEYLVPGVPQCLASQAVHVQDAALLVEQEEPIGGVVHENAEPLFAGAQRLLGLPEVGDVGACPKPLDDVAAAVADRHATRLEPAVFTVVPADTVFNVVGVTPRHGLQPELPRRLAVVGVQGLQPAPAEQVRLRDAGVLRPLGAEVVAGAVRRRGPDELRQRLGQAPPALFTLAQRFLGALELRDVAGDAERAGDPAVRVAEGHLGGGDPPHVAVEPGLLLLLAHQRLSRADDVQFVLTRQPGVLLREEVEIRLADRLRGVAEAEVTCQGLVDADEAAADVLEVNVVREVVQERVKQIALVGQRLFRELELGDVAGHAERADDGAIRVAQGHLGGGNPAHAAVEVDPFFLLADDGPAGAQDLLFVLMGRPGMFLGEEIEVRLADRFGGVGQAEERSQGLVDAEEAALSVLKINLVGDVVQERVEERAFLAQGLLGLQALSGDAFQFGDVPAPLDQRHDLAAQDAEGLRLFGGQLPRPTVDDAQRPQRMTFRGHEGAPA